jgi:hypothetical protein
LTWIGGAAATLWVSRPTISATAPRKDFMMKLLTNAQGEIKTEKTE